MRQKINVYARNNPAVNALHAMGQTVKQSKIDQSLLGLIHFRVSQINRCAFCLDMHSKELRAKGESEQRLHVMAAWRETPFFSEKERATLAYAEALTTLTPHGVPASREDARKHFSDEEMVDLTMSIIAINSYNRLNAAFEPPVGSYKRQQHVDEPATA